MFSRVVRAGVSLAVVLAAYWCYALVAVPLIEPAADGPRQLAAYDPDKPVETAATRHEQLLRPYFPAGHWVYQNPKVLENEQTKLLIKDYRNLPDGRVELKPCAVMFFPKQRAENSSAPQGQVIIMEAPEGAIIEFDEAFDLRKARVGKLVGGQLVGPITIHSVPDPNAPGGAGAGNALRIVTRDVNLIDNRVVTPHPVDFRYGANYGSGRDMTIQLTQADDQNGRKSRSPQFGGIESFSLASDVKMYMQMGGGGLMPGGKAGGPPSLTPPARPAVAKPKSLKPESDEPPVQVTCNGAFRFDVVRQAATFADHVDVLRLNPNGPSDQLNCELLSIFFASKEPTTPHSADKAKPKPIAGGFAKLEARRIEARGDPVVVRSPSTGGHARCQRLEYDIPTGRISLEGNGDVLLHQGANEIRTRKLDYEPAAAGRLGKLLASGPGTLQGTMAENPAQKYQAQWTRELRMRPHEQSQVVSLLGGAQMRYTDMGGLAADEIHLWLREPVGPASSPAVPPQPIIQPVAHTQKITQRAIEPERMMAMGNVQIDSPQMTGSTGRLEVWFERLLGEALTDSAGGRSASSTARTAPANQRFDIAGTLVRVQLAVRGQSTSLADVSVEGNAKFSETKTPKPDEKPLLVKGDKLHLAQADSPQAALAVVGGPAYVEARGMSLTGAKIQLERSSNRLWIDGAGRMTLPVDRDLSGNAAAIRQTLEVTWQGDMNFDGRTIAYSRTVVARGQHQLLRTDLLQVSLKNRIDFANPSAARDGQRSSQAEVDEIVCSGGMYLESRDFDNRGQSAYNLMQAVDLNINQTSGAINARGPGFVTTVRRGAAGADALGRRSDREPSTESRPSETPPQENGDEKRLTYLNVKFQRSITGNLHKRELTFADQVKTTYGPVDDWDKQLEVDDPAGLGPNGVILNCDQLTVREMTLQPGAQGAQGKRGPVELEALGNTLVEGETFTARAHRLTFAEEKDLLVLEGDGRTDAQLFRQPRPGAPTTKAAARKIMYWRNTNRVEVDDARYFDLGQFPGSEPAPAKPAPPPSLKSTPQQRPAKALPRGGFRG